MRWQIDGGVIYSQLNTNETAKIAGFNLYGTIITADWRLMYPNTREKLKNLHDEGYMIVLFINRPSLIQKGKHESFIARIEDLIRRLSIPLEVYIATEDNRYMKPMTGMWEMCGRRTGIFCGDCAGRIYGKRDTDYNQCDRLFALNTGLRFYTPEQLFVQPERPYRIPPGYVVPLIKEEPFPWELLKKETKNKPHIIITVGCPVSWKGKVVDDIVIKFGKGNYYVVHDIEELKVAISERRNIIMDNRNPRRDHIYQELKQKYARIILYFDFPKQLCMHLNHYRLQKDNVKKQSLWVFEKYYEQLEVPTEEEGVVISIKPENVLRDLGEEYNFAYDI